GMQGDLLRRILAGEGQTEDSWVYSAGSHRYNNRRIALDTEGYSLVISAPFLADEYALSFFPGLIGYACGFVVLSALLALGLTVLLLYPIRGLKKTFDEQFTYGKYRGIRGGLRRFPFPMLYRVLLILLLSVMGPAVVSGLLFQNQMHRYVIDSHYDYLKKVSASVSESVRDRMEHTLLLSALFPENQIADYIQGSYRVNSILKTKLDTVFSEGGTFSHYAIFDSSRREIYNSRTVSFSDPLILLADRASADGRRYVMMAVDNARGGQLPAIVYRVTGQSGAGEEGEEESRETVGYFALYLNMNRFYELRPDIGHEFFLTGPQGEILISSVSEGVAEDVLDRIGSLSDGRSLSTDEYLVITDNNGVFGGKIITYNDMRYYTIQRETLRYQYSLVFFGVAALITVAAVWISRRLSLPLSRIGESMQSFGDVSEFRPLSYTHKDEIAGLVESYNRMVARMSSLIEENARRISRENELIALNTRTELQMLQQQINPHLLYNTLEFISYNAKREGSSAAGDMAMALADFFRYTTSVREDIVSFRDELTHVKNYIEIHRLRYGERFDTVYDITDEALNCRVVKFILQPFVENAFKYGIANKL
ncbi:MAG: histidine kinase, partial [Clostridia bacterium]|nr:histidine kinase [Clostridia bacterium]